MNPEIFGCLTDDPIFSSRIVTEAMYRTVVAEELPLINEIRKDEAFKIPLDFNFWDKKISFSDEEREKLTMARPQTVRCFSIVYLNLLHSFYKRIFHAFCT